MENNGILDPGYLEPLQGATLFYPCSGRDWMVPITLFAPVIQDFIFVDSAYFSTGAHWHFRITTADGDLSDARLTRPVQRGGRW
jgi:hypothetical protein